jgi:hypothetical protein
VRPFDEKEQPVKARTFLAALLAACAGSACAHGSMTELSVYDRTEGRRLPVYWHEGRAYVVGKPGNEYQVSIKNRQREDLLAVISVDGINVISGETADSGQTGYVLGSCQAYDIQGWRKSLSQTAAFYFTALPDSYAARTGRPDNVGVIGVALFRRKQEPPQPLSQAPAPAEAEMRRGRAASEAADARLGTGHGRRETSYVRNVEFERASTSPAETIALYYDSYRNLVARGVIKDLLPKPFPGFVPDPRG